MAFRKAPFLALLAKVHHVVSEEITGNAQGGGYRAGLANEGYAGGYLAALQDVEAMMTHGHPSDSRYYWRRAMERHTSGKTKA
jgi:hypothetical protein